MDYLIITTILCFAYLLLAWRIRKNKSEAENWEESENRPDDLKASKLWLSEKEISADRPVPLHGKVDQVFRLSNGLHCIVDTKRRKKPTVFLADIIQCSVYATILHSNGIPVSSTGYIRRVFNDQVNYIPFQLLEVDKVVALYHRRNYLLNHPEQAEYTPYPGMCYKCGQRENANCTGKGYDRKRALVIDQIQPRSGTKRSGV